MRCGGAITDFCRETGQRAPEHPADVAAVILRSLALEHRLGLQALERVTGRRHASVRMVGGGSANRTLCRLTADAVGRPVIAGPTEATAAGNLLIQARTLGLVAELQPVIERSLNVVTYEPGGSIGEAEFERFEALKRGERV